jgi:hypothetical protein
MWFISKLRGIFGLGVEQIEEPMPEFVDPVLGAMKWNEDDEAWIGEYNGFRFALSYERKREPTLAVIEYARETLANPQHLNDGLAQAKAAAARDYEQYYLDEARSLIFGLIHFYFYKNQPRIFAELEGGRDFRCWRIQYSGTKCEGMGFDN